MGPVVHIVLNELAVAVVELKARNDSLCTLCNASGHREDSARLCTQRRATLNVAELLSPSETPLSTARNAPVPVTVTFPGPSLADAPESSSVPLEIVVRPV